MRRLARPKPLVILFLMIALIALLAIGQYLRLFERAWFNLHTLWQPVSSEAIGLDQYRVAIEARPIDGLDDDVSALTYDPVRKSLFTVTNKNSELIELSLEGKILRRIALVGFGDPEAVEYISADTYVITDERQQRLIKIHLEADTTFLDAEDAEQMTLGVHMASNKGFGLRLGGQAAVRGQRTRPDADLRSPRFSALQTGQDLRGARDQQPQARCRDVRA